MSLLILAIEYLILHSIFDTIRVNDEKAIEQSKTSTELLNNWKPLPDKEISNIKRLTS